MAMPKTEYTPEQIAEAAHIVEATFDPETGKHPADIFHAICRTTVRPVVELVIFTPNKDKILLTERSQDDPFFSGMWHLPGVIVLPTDIGGRYPDASDNAALRAIEELEGTKITPLTLLTPKWFNQGPRMGLRGGEAAMFYGGLLIDEEPAVGRMFDVGNLPEALLEQHHSRLIEAAQEAMCVAPAIDWPVITY